MDVRILLMAEFIAEQLPVVLKHACAHTRSHVDRDDLLSSLSDRGFLLNFLWLIRFHSSIFHVFKGDAVGNNPF